MAVDRAVQIARDRGLVPPTLRLYGWSRPTVSLGRFQDALGVDIDYCREHGVDVVRRFTGGRGVLHDDELTYCVVASESDGVPRGIANSYRYLSASLAEAYRLLGVAADLVPREGGAKDSAACYLHSSPADLSLGGRKLSGSAQVWLHDTVMQHGSFVITRDIAREARAFRLEPAAARALAATTVTLADELDALPPREELIEGVVAGFQRGLGVTFMKGSLTDRERDMATELSERVTVTP